jgi:hypothetical protein
MVFEKGQEVRGQASRTVYVLQHSYELDGCEEAKLIGIYTSAASAEGAKQRLRLQPGFRDQPDNFVVDAYELDADHWKEGFVTERR